MASSQIEAIIAVVSALAENAPAHYQEILDDALERMQYEANRTRERDLESVIHCIRIGAVTTRDIAAETKIAQGHVAFLLRLLCRNGTVSYRLRHESQPKRRPVRIYYLRSPAPRKNKPAA